VIYRVTDEDGENEREIEGYNAADAAEEYAAMVHDNGADPRDMVILVDGKRYKITLDYSPIYYAVED